MRVHFILNQGTPPESKLADVEIYFEEGLLAGCKLVGTSVWRGKKSNGPSVLIPARSYATAGGVRYYELIRPDDRDEGSANGASVKRFKDFIKTQYEEIAAGGKGPA